jgi:hypothetical protein
LTLTETLRRLERDGILTRITRARNAYDRRVA